MKKTLLNALKVLVISLTVNSCGWDWEPKPYVGDSLNKQLINKHGEIISCDQPAFDEMTCFDPENIAELKSAIDKVKTKKKNKTKIKKLIDEATVINGI